MRSQLQTITAVLASSCVLGMFTPHATASLVAAVEYYHQASEHYFVTADSAQIAALDSGLYAGWWRTGQRYQVDNAPGPAMAPVCRFYTDKYAQKPSHFFTASAAECDVLKLAPDWTYEGVAFYVPMPDAQGHCPAATASVQRLYNNGRGNAPNHAYTIDPVKKDVLAGAGWVAEGVAWCTPEIAEGTLAPPVDLPNSHWRLAAPLAFGPRMIDNYFAGSWAVTASPTAPFLADHLLQTFGLALPQTWILATDGSEFWTEATWDAAGGSYVMATAISDRVTGELLFGAAWTFNQARTSQVAVCAMAVHQNRETVPPYALHPFQPILWSGCEPGVANVTFEPA